MYLFRIEFFLIKTIAMTGKTIDVSHFKDSGKKNSILENNDIQNDDFFQLLNKMEIAAGAIKDSLKSKIHNDNVVDIKSLLKKKN